MTKPIFLTCLGVCLGATALLFGQGGPLDPADLLKPLRDNWTTYSGDYTGRRYSFLRQVTAENVKGLSMEWFNTGITSACGPNGTSTQASGGGGGVASDEAAVVAEMVRPRSSSAASATVSPAPTRALPRDSRAAFSS